MLEVMTPTAFRLGTPVHLDALNALGFVRHDLRFRTPVGPDRWCEWDTLGDVPDSGGLYAFVLTRAEWTEPRVAYVGLTTHLWMVTKGHLPRNGGARGGQRYGRPKHAGSTRVRVNGLIAEARREHCEVSHWLSPRPELDSAGLHREEQRLIDGWNLRVSGWNIG